MEEQLKALEARFQEECQAASSPGEIEALKVKYLGRKSVVNQFFAKIPSLPPQARGAWGRRLNSFKEMMTATLDQKSSARPRQEEKLDLTYPGLPPARGLRHVLNAVNCDICDIFQRQGFVVAEGSEIEDEWHNFTALNFPVDHPSRDAFDTFYLDLAPSPRGGKRLLRCHTSPSQIRIMQEVKPPLAVISPGRVYRPDEVDATHSFMFHQVEGFAVGRDINFAHLKGVLLDFARSLFGPEVSLRFRPHFFPFTEPSAEVDISCFICSGEKKKSASRQPGGAKRKCSICKGKGWLEILGCGMIHPEVLEACSIDSKKYQGFAFGLGVERIAMLKYGIDDIRLFYENDVRFLEQF